MKYQSWLCSSCNNGNMMKRNEIEYMCDYCGAIFDKKIVDKRIYEANTIVSSWKGTQNAWKPPLVK